MPIYSYKCPACETRFDELVPMAERETHPCIECGKTAKQVITPVHFDSLAMGTDPTMATFAAKFDRLHRQQTEKEKKIYREHGDYGPSPGS